MSLIWRDSLDWPRTCAEKKERTLWDRIDKDNVLSYRPSVGESNSGIAISIHDSRRGSDSNIYQVSKGIPGASEGEQRDMPALVNLDAP